MMTPTATVVRRLCLFSLLSVLLALPATAQPYTGDLYFVTAEGFLVRTDRAGNARLLADAPTVSDGIAVAWDNQGVLWTEWGNAFSRTPSRIHEWRNGRDTVLFSTTDFQIEELVVNQNGEIVFTGEDRSIVPNVTGVFTWHGGATVTTIATTVAFGESRALLDGGMDIDIGSGDYLVSSGPLVPPAEAQVWAIAPSGMATRLVKTYCSGAQWESGLTAQQDKYDGTILQGGLTYYGVIDANGLKDCRFPKPFSGRYLTLRLDRASVPTSLRKLYATRLFGASWPGFLQELTNLGQLFPVISLTTLTTINSVSARGMVFADENNIGSMKTGPGTYTLNVNFPGEGGKRYAVGIGVTGYKPGLTLADGRHICLNVDALTFASLHNLLRPAFDPGPGTLDTTGNATGSIALGVDGLNVLLHMVAMTMSSGTIDTISSPTVFKL